MRKSATTLLLFTALFAVRGLWAQEKPAGQTPTPQNPAKPEPQSNPETTLRVDVKLVNVFVTVTDAHGAPIGGLAKENFILKEDDQLQKIAVFDKESALPLSIALAIESGSADS